MDEVSNNNSSQNDIQLLENLDLSYLSTNKKETPEEPSLDFNKKMDSLLSKLQTQLNNVKKYANIKLPNDTKYIANAKTYTNNDFDEDGIKFKDLEIVEKKPEDNENNSEIYNLKSKNNVNDSIKNQESIDKNEEKNPHEEIGEICSINFNESDIVLNNSQEEKEKQEEEERQKREMEEQERIRKIKEEEEQERLKKLKEEEEREEKLKEEERLLKIKEEEEERKRLEEEEAERKRQEEEEERYRLLEEEEKRLKREEEEKALEEEKENERIKKERIENEKKEKEEKARKKKEEEEKQKKEQLEKKKKQEEEEKLLKQMNNQKKKDSKEKEPEIDIDGDDYEDVKIEEIGDIEEISSEKENENPKIKQTIVSARKIEEDKKSEKKNEINVEEIESIKSKEDPKSQKNIKKKTDNKKLKSSNRSNHPEPKKVPKSNVKNENNYCESVQNFLKFKHISKLSEKCKQDIIDYIEAVDKFDVKNPDLSDLDQYIKIDNFVEKEEKLSEIIPKFQEDLIKNDSEEKKNLRKNFFLSHDYCNLKTQTNRKLMDETANIETPHTSLMQQIFKEKGLKNLEKYEEENYENFEKKNFEETELYNNFNSPIRSLENLQTFIYKFSANESYKLLINAYKVFNHWRPILGDGNSFYRTFMLALLENYILTNNEAELNNLLSEVTSDDFIEIYKNEGIDYEIPFTILYFILKFTKEKKTNLAYKLLLKSYKLKNECFDKLLIIYLRNVVYKFSHLVYESWLGKNKDNENTENINLEEIKNMYIEPNFFVIGIMPYLFDINLDVIWVDNLLLKPNDGVINLVDEDNGAPNISIGFFYSSYYRIYSRDYDEKEVFKECINEDKPEITQLMYRLPEKQKCNLCNKATEHLAFLQKKFVICGKCLENYIKNTICKKRYNAFIEDEYYGQEYYTRRIPIQNDIYLDDFDFIEIFENQNIIDYLSTNYCCYICQSIPSNENKLVKIDCGCIYCENCIMEKIKELTDGYMYLNECEIDDEKRIKCQCGKFLDYAILSKYYKQTDNDIKKAEGRLLIFIRTRCMICFKNLKNNNLEDIRGEKSKTIQMKKEKEKKIPSITDHLMCINCYNNNFKTKITDENQDNVTKESIDDPENNREVTEEQSNKKNNTQTSNYVDKEACTVKCDICNEVHKYKPSGGGCECLIY